MKLIFDKFLQFIKENKLLSFSFLIVFIFFILQHLWALGWDFSAYVINARYFFNRGDYAEVLRAPLTSFFLVGMVFFGKIGEYFYISLTVILFFFANFKLASYLYTIFFYKYEINRKEFILLFLIFSITPFVLHYGLLEGTELLGLAFFELFILYFLKNKSFGHFLGLAVLTRYNFLAFVPLIFINRNYKKIIKNLVLFGLVLSPWLIFNYFRWGNFFMSIVESYNHSILARASLMRPFNFFDLFSSINFLLLFLLFGLIYIVFNFIKRKEMKIRIRYDFLFLAIFLICLWDYSRTPFKIERYLFNLSFPIAYFSVTGFLIFLRVFSRYKKKILIGVFILWVIMICVLFINFYNLRWYDNMYRDAAKVILDRGFKGCYVASHHWVPLNYYTGNAYSLWKTPQEIISMNGIVVIFPQDITIDDSFTLDSIKDLPVLESQKRYIIFANPNLTPENCEKRFPYDVPAVSEPCKIIGERFKVIGIHGLVERGCLLFNKV